MAKAKRKTKAKRNPKAKARAQADKLDTTPPKTQGKDRHDWKPVFLVSFRETGNVRAACEAAQVARQTAYNARNTDDEFAKVWDEAEEDACDMLELEARRRAHDGTDKPITFRGVVYDTYKEYSDTLLMFLLRAHRPGKFGDRARNENWNLDVSTLNDKQLELLANGAPLATVLAFASEGGAGAAAASAGNDQTAHPAAQS